MVSQWSKTAWGKAWPEVAARSVEVNPKDSMTGRYAFKLKMGVPAQTKHNLSGMECINTGRQSQSSTRYVSKDKILVFGSTQESHEARLQLLAH